VIDQQPALKPVMSNSASNMAVPSGCVGVTFDAAVTQRELDEPRGPRWLMRGAAWW
jgi:hypothetical protein